ncbi:hypothetical protein C1H46_019021 [Malus baccata]|uniref:Uncharacterized protein n=1 Tax=Malus baccata TaxID=106549 RepID=A0A540M9F2_MALBA|nr:hypothetical protein C1H46_019021 [Malus baccata]
MIRIHGEENGGMFFCHRQNLLNNCKVWWESDQDIHPWYLNLALKFPISEEDISMLQSISKQSHSCFVPYYHLRRVAEQMVKANLGLQEFRIFYIMRRGSGTLYFFQSR